MQAMDEFTTEYARTALWASSGLDGEESLEGHDLAESTKRTFQRDCDEFRRMMHEAGPTDYLATRPGEVAHDLFLTRNGHGAGFWDGDWPEPYASRFTTLAQGMGEAELYVGDDGLVYQFGESS